MLTRRRLLVVTMVVALLAGGGGLWLEFSGNSFPGRTERASSEQPRGGDRDRPPRDRSADSAPESIVRGRAVHALTRAPIPGVEVSLTDQTTSTRASGDFLLTVASGGRPTLRLSADAFRPLARVVVADRRDIDLGDIVLVPIPSLSGRVALPDGRPAPGAKWRLCDRNERTWQAGEADGAGRFQVSVTDALSRAMRVRNTRLHVDAWLAGVGPGRAEVREGPIIVRLTAGRTVRGRVVEHGSGAPVAEATLRVAPSSRSDTGNGWVAGNSAEDGTFEIVGVDPAWSLVVEAGGYSTRSFAGSSVESPLQVELRRAGRIDGIVVGPREHPAPGAVVYVKHRYRPEPIGVETMGLKTVADEHGAFTFDRVEVGRALVIDAIKDGMNGPLEYDGMPTGPVRIKLRVPDGFALCEVRVIDEADQPVAGARVYTDLFGASLPARTDARGIAWFVLDRSLSRPATLLAEADGRHGVRSGVWVTDWVAAGPLDIRVTRAAIAIGRLTLPEGVGSAVVSGWWIGPENAAVLISDVTVQANDSFALPMRAGAGVVVVEGDAVSPVVRRLQVRTGTQDAGHLVPDAAVPLEGRVTLGGQPVKATVRCFPEAPIRKLLRHTTLAVKTSDDGRFRFPSVPGGVLRLVARRTRRDGGGSGEVTTRREAGSVEITVKVPD